MNPALTLIAASIAAILGFGTAWQLQAGNITQLELKAANERIAIQRASRQVIERQTAQLATAQSNAAGRAVVLRRDVRSAALVGDGLRIKTADAVRSANDDPATCNTIVAAYSAVVDSSSRFIQDVSADADRCHIDLELMRESWPR